MAQGILLNRCQELPPDNLDVDLSIFDEALFELNKKVEFPLSKSIKDFVFTLPLNFNLNATNNIQYLRETNSNHSRIQVTHDESRLNTKQKNVHDIISS